MRFPEAGGSSSFARHAYNELVSFGAAWAQMLVYVVTVATSAFFVPHYLSIFWGPLRENPWDIVGGVIVIVALVVLNIVGVQEAAKLSITLAVLDFATQVLLVALGFVLVLSPEILVDNIHWGVAPTWGNLAIAVPVAMLAYTGVETVSNLAEEVRDPVKNVPERVQARRVRGLRDLLHAAADRALGPAGRADRRRADDAAGAVAGGGRLCERSHPRRRPEPRHRRRPARRARDLRRHPRRHDPLHRHERGRHRRVSDHLRDGDLPADPGGLPPAAPALQDSVALDPPLRRGRSDRGDPARRRQVRRDAVLVRRDAVVHHRARVADPPADAPRPGGDSLPREAEPSARRDRLAAVRALRRARDRDLVHGHRPPEPADALGRARLDRHRSRLLRGLPPPRRARAADARP